MKKFIPVEFVRCVRESKRPVLRFCLRSARSGMHSQHLALARPLPAIGFAFVRIGRFGRASAVIAATEAETENKQRANQQKRTPKYLRPNSLSV